MKTQITATAEEVHIHPANNATKRRHKNDMIMQSLKAWTLALFFSIFILRAQGQFYAETQYGSFAEHPYFIQSASLPLNIRISYVGAIPPPEAINPVETSLYIVGIQYRIGDGEWIDGAERNYDPAYSHDYSFTDIQTNIGALKVGDGVWVRTIEGRLKAWSTDTYLLIHEPEKLNFSIIPPLLASQPPISLLAKQDR